MKDVVKEFPIIEVAVGRSEATQAEECRRQVTS
jgi:hypothetical protein